MLVGNVRYETVGTGTVSTVNSPLPTPLILSQFNQKIWKCVGAERSIIVKHAEPVLSRREESSKKSANIGVYGYRSSSSSTCGRLISAISCIANVIIHSQKTRQKRRVASSKKATPALVLVSRQQS